LSSLYKVEKRGEKKIIVSIDKEKNTDLSERVIEREFDRASVVFIDL